MRILFFDLWRIIAISLVVVQHTAGTFNLNWLTATYGPLGRISGITGLGGNLGNIGVELFIILSGCVLEYQYGAKVRAGLLDLYQFIRKRILHLYPAYWMSLILALVLTPSLFSIGIPEILKAASGFWIFQTTGSGIPGIVQPINPLGWFIGLIITLYLMYPMLSDFLAQYKWALFWIFAGSVTARVILLLLFPTGNEWYWFPLSRMFEFSLGIWLVQEGWYWKTESTNRIITYASALSFPVFLTHYLFIGLLPGNLPLYIAVVLGTSAVMLNLSDRIGDLMEMKTKRTTTP
jgi:peptidoglycan/LPS O-acetylase OafA/YrhL